MPHNHDSLSDDSYFTVKQFAHFETKVRASRFIGRARAVVHRGEAEAFVADVARQHFDATHNCFAYRVGIGSEAIFRYSDDGEPAGTAGRPILRAIENRKLSNTVVVVTRYFGGTKLGTGGLARAYAECAQQTLERAGQVEKFLTRRFVLTLPYELQNAVMKVVGSVGGEIVSTDYGEEAHLLVSVRRGLVDELRGRILQASSGRTEISEA